MWSEYLWVYLRGRSMKGREVEIYSSWRSTAVISSSRRRVLKSLDARMYIRYLPMRD